MNLKREDFAPLGWMAGLLIAALVLFLAFNVSASELGKDRQGNIFEAFKIGTVHNRTFSTSSASELHTAFGGTTRAAEIICTAACYVVQRVSPASVSAACLDGACANPGFVLPANTLYRVRVRDPDQTSIRAIGVSGSGTISIVELE